MHPADHTPSWVYGTGDNEGRVWCRICRYGTEPRHCLVCGELADEATVKHGNPGDYQLHQPVFAT